MNDILLNPPNELSHIEKVYAVLSRDEQGHEAVCGFTVPELGLQPMLTVNPRLWEQVYLPAALTLQRKLKGTGKRLFIVEFVGRVDIREIAEL